MEAEKGKKLLDLTRKLRELNKEIVKVRTQTGKETPELRKQFYDTEEEIKDILAESGPLDKIRDPQVRDTLRKVRNGDYFELDKELNKIVSMLKNLPPDIIEKIFSSKGISVSDEEVDEEIDRVIFAFQEEMIQRMDPEEYFQRKKDFGTIIADSGIHPKIQGYFTEIRECFLFGQLYAVIGLCRVILELAFRDRFEKLHLDRRFQSPKVYPLDNYKIPQIIDRVCRRLGTTSLGDVAKDLWSTSSNILHGRETNIKLEVDEILTFVKKTFNTIEKLYRS